MGILPLAEYQRIVIERYRTSYQALPKSATPVRLAKAMQDGFLVSFWSPSYDVVDVYVVGLIRNGWGWQLVFSTHPGATEGELRTWQKIRDSFMPLP